MKLRPGAPLSRSRSSSGRMYCAALVACGFTNVTESLTSTVVAMTATASVMVRAGQDAGGLIDGRIQRRVHGNHGSTRVQHQRVGREHRVRIPRGAILLRHVDIFGVDGTRLDLFPNAQALE